MLSSVKGSKCRRPLKPSNGAPPPRKKQKSSISIGKENQRVQQVTKASSSRVSSVHNEEKGAEVKIWSLLAEVSESEKGKGVDLCELQNGETVQKNDENVSQDAWVSPDWEEREAVAEERKQLSASIGSVSEIIQSTYVSNSCSSSFCDPKDSMNTKSVEADEVEEQKPCLWLQRESKVEESFQKGQCDIKDFNICEDVSSLKAEGRSFYLMSIESRLMESKPKLCPLNIPDSCRNVELRVEEKNLKSKENLDGCKDAKGLKTGRGSPYSKSIESRLLESGKKYDSSDAGVCYGDFEPGTQLNVLMDLCCEIREGYSENGDFYYEENGLSDEAFELEGDGLVECPLCGTDITHLSEELRQVHTNDCLDKDGTTEVILSLLTFSF